MEKEDLGLMMSTSWEVSIRFSLASCACTVRHCIMCKVNSFQFTLLRILQLMIKWVITILKLKLFVIPPNSSTFSDLRERVTCRGSKLTNSLRRTKLTNSLGEQQRELSTCTWSGRAPWKCGKYICQPLSSIFFRSLFHFLVGRYKKRVMTGTTGNSKFYYSWSKSLSSYCALTYAKISQPRTQSNVLISCVQIIHHLFKSSFTYLQFMKCYFPQMECSFIAGLRSSVWFVGTHL